ncbi:MAG: type I 3-dehydroquinate dehydratase [Candidatus Delongbacteria bacterium]|nr:type I 3-dehydroquinate dehydratase [Candidatus Delongbacteria bacterium]
MICLSVGKAKVNECLEIIKGSEIAEIRLDLNIYTDEELELIFSSHNNLIATCREGKYNLDERKLLLSKAIKFGAKYLDIELVCEYTMRSFLVNLAKMSNCEVIISYHNYEKCPTRDHMKDIVKRCFDGHADIAKIVCKVNSIDDNINILSLYELEKNILAFGMGKLGRITRIAAPYLGAPFTYAFPKDMKRTAEGQFSVDKLQNIINLIDD